MQLSGYYRVNGTVGFRNHLLVLSSVVCANRTAEAIAAQVPGAVAVTHQHGCCHLGGDREQVLRTLAGVGRNPNVGAVLVVGLGCENVPAPEVAARIAPTGKPTRCLVIQEEGGTQETIAKGVAMARELAVVLDQETRRPCEPAHLVLAVECGGSDATSGLAANPVIGAVADKVLALGGKVILSETTEFIGAEHLLAARAVSSEVGAQILEIVERVEKKVLAIGEDIRGSQPTPGNIAGGLTTIEEKSLGCIHKGGTWPVVEVLEYGAEPTKTGLVVMDTPGQDVESISGMIAGGAQVVLFSTGRGTPTGSPIAPVIKVTGNPATYRKLKGDIDFNAGTVIDGTESVAEAADRLFTELLEVLNGRPSKAEIAGQHDFAIYRIGPTI